MVTRAKGKVSESRPNKGTSNSDIRVLMVDDFILGTEPSQARRKICKEFDGDVINERRIQTRFIKFKDGDEALQDATRIGRVQDYRQRDTQSGY